MKKALKKQAQNTQVHTFHRCPVQSASRFFKGALRDAQKWTTNSDIVGFSTVYFHRSRTLSKPVVTRPVMKKICPLTGRNRSVGGRFGLSRISFRTALKASFLSGTKKSS
jgi:ribosomal protein S14